MTEYRFFINEHDGNGTPTILRSKPYRLGYGDEWDAYWDGSEMVAVYDSRNYNSPTRSSNPEWTERAERVIESARQYSMDVDKALTTLARRLFGYNEQTGEPHAPDACFIPVGLDRGVTLYCLSWAGDPDHTYRDEVEACYHGDVWRVEVEEWTGDGWRQSDDVCDQWYGEDKALAAWERDFPLDAFPAEAVLAEAVGA